MYKFEIGDEVCLSKGYSIFLNNKEIIYEVCAVESITVRVRCKTSGRYDTYMKDIVVLHRHAAQVKLEKRLAKIDTLLTANV